jgi:hypothetical protein
VRTALPQKKPPASESSLRVAVPFQPCISPQTYQTVETVRSMICLKSVVDMQGVMMVF